MLVTTVVKTIMTYVPLVEVVFFGNLKFLGLIIKKWELLKIMLHVWE